MAADSISKNPQNYAYFSGAYQSKTQTVETLTKWILMDDSVKSVSQTLNVNGLSWKELISHQNYKAFKDYFRLRKQ